MPRCSLQAENGHGAPDPPALRRLGHVGGCRPRSHRATAACVALAQRQIARLTPVNLRYFLTSTITDTPVGAAPSRACGRAGLETRVHPNWLSTWRVYRHSIHTAAEPRERMLARQNVALRRLLDQVGELSPFYRPYRNRPFQEWPCMNKTLALAKFDQVNTRGLRIVDADNALRSAAGLRGCSVTVRVGDLRLIRSPGTSGVCGLALLNGTEQGELVGTILAKLLPRSFWRREKIAAILHGPASIPKLPLPPWISLQYYDANEPVLAHVDALNAERPTVLLASAHALRALALAKSAGALTASPRRVISAAEVLEKRDRALIASQLGRPHEIYYAHEGLLATTCTRGVLHLDEENLVVERDDLGNGRFVPVVTHLRRITHPVIRYRLDDVLVERSERCLCGHPGTAIESIDGRVDDQWLLPTAAGATVRVYAGLLHAVTAQAIPMHMEYQLQQVAPARVSLRADLTLGNLQTVQDRLNTLLLAQGADIGSLKWDLLSTGPEHPIADRHRTVTRRQCFEL